MTKTSIRAARFDLPDLRLFVALVETGSLSRAAARLSLALSAASARLKALESRTGLLFFERRVSGLIPTSAGKSFFEYARRVTLAAEEAQSMLDSFHGADKITLTVLSNAMGISTGLPSHLGRFLQSNPTFDLRLEQHPTRHAVKAVTAGEADIGIVDETHAGTDLALLPYRRDRLVVLVPKSHALTSRAKWPFSEVLSYPLVGMDSSSSLQQFNEEMAFSEGLTPRFRAFAPTFRDAAQLVAENVGIAILPDGPARRYQDDSDLAIVELDDPWAVRTLQICVKSTSSPKSPARMLACFLSEAASSDHALT